MGFFFLFFTRFALGDNYHCSCTIVVAIIFTHCNGIVHVLFMRPTTTLFRKKKNLNESYGTIHTFKNYFAKCFQFSILAKISCIQMDPRTGLLQKIRVLVLV